MNAEKRHEARRLASDAAAAWVTQEEGTEGVIVTGYVLAIECIGTDGQYGLFWATGDGRPPDPDGDDLAGLAPHRVTGILRGCVDEIIAGLGQHD